MAPKKNTRKTKKSIKKEIKREVARTASKKMPRTGGDHNFVVQSKSLMNLLDQNKSALLAMSITGRLPVPIPDGCNKRVNVNPLYAAFPLQGNTTLGTPSLLDSSGNFSLAIKASLKNTISTSTQTAMGVATSYGKTINASSSSFYSTASLATYAGGGTYPGVYFEDTASAKIISSYPGSVRVFFPFSLPPANTTTNGGLYTIQEAESSSSVIQNPFGYLMQTGQTFTCGVDAVCDGSTIGWLNTTTNTLVSSPTTVTGGINGTNSMTVGSNTNATAGQYVVPFILTSGAVLVRAFTCAITSSTTTNTAGRSVDMPQSTDPLWASTYKKSRITGFAVWFQNTSNVTKVGGDCGAFWLNPDQAAVYSLPGSSGVIAAASTRTRDRYVGPFVNGIYSFERIHRENLVFQPSLEIDDGYRLIIAGSPGASSVSDVQGYIHVWMIVESEVESSVLAGSIAPHMVNVMAEFETAVSRVPNNVMENSAHAQILSAIMKAGSKVGGAIRNVVSLPWVKNAAGAGASAVLHNLANSASPGYNYGPALTPYQNAQRRQRRPPRKR